MASANIDIVAPTEHTLIAGLYNQIFKPERDEAFLERRFLGRHHALVLVASVEDHAVGFLMGFELKPTVFFIWLFGVLPDSRRQGIASQLLEAAQAWARENQYVSIRMECPNHHRAPLHMAIDHDYDIVGIRWDPDLGHNLVILDRVLDQ